MCLALIFVTAIDGYPSKFLKQNVFKRIFRMKFVVHQVALG
jgi:hypothetical protein